MYQLQDATVCHPSSVLGHFWKMGRAAQAESVSGARRVHSAKPDRLIKISREVSKCLILNSEDNLGAFGSVRAPGLKPFCRTSAFPLYSCACTCTSLSTQWHETITEWYKWQYTVIRLSYTASEVSEELKKHFPVLQAQCAVSPELQRGPKLPRRWTNSSLAHDRNTAGRKQKCNIAPLWSSNVLIFHHF